MCQKTNMREPMSCWGQINVTSQGHNLVYNGKYWILHPGNPNYSDKVAFFYGFYLLEISYTCERLEINKVLEKKIFKGLHSICVKSGNL